MSSRALIAVLALSVLAVTIFAWRQSHHRSADQEILIQRSHQH